jgi:putative transposase
VKLYGFCVYIVVSSSGIGVTVFVDKRNTSTKKVSKVLVAHVYKLRPKVGQSTRMDCWLDMLRSNYNWNLVDRIETYNQRFKMGEYCDIRTKSVCYPLSCLVGGASGYPYKQSRKTGEVKRRNPGEIQMAELPELKEVRPWYKDIDASVLQENVKRLDTAYKNFFEGRGFPKFKNHSTFHSFSYAQGVKIDGNKIYLPKLGWMSFFNSRAIPSSFTVKTVTVRKKADGWYVSVRIEDKTVPDYSPPRLEDIKTLTSCDLGITKLVHLSDGSQIDNPRFSTNKKTARMMRIRQRRVSRKVKGSKNKALAAKLVGRLHKRIADRRNSYQWQVAHSIVRRADAVGLENLNVKGMKSRCKPKKEEGTGRFLRNNQSAKRGLNRAISDASWGELVSKIEYVAAKSGKIIFKIDPKFTSQKCSQCGHIDKLSRSGEKFICTNCGHMDHADLQAAKNVKSKVVEQFGLTLRVVRRDSPKPCEPTQLCLGIVVADTPIRPKTPRRKGKRGGDGNPTQLSLFDLVEWDTLSESSSESPCL